MMHGQQQQQPTMTDRRHRAQRRRRRRAQQQPRYYSTDSAAAISNTARHGNSRNGHFGESSRHADDHEDVHHDREDTSCICIFVADKPRLRHAAATQHHVPPTSTTASAAPSADAAGAAGLDFSASPMDHSVHGDVRRLFDSDIRRYVYRLYGQAQRQHALHIPSLAQQKQGINLSTRTTFLYIIMRAIPAAYVSIHLTIDTLEQERPVHISFTNAVKALRIIPEKNKMMLPFSFLGRKWVIFAMHLPTLLKRHIQTPSLTYRRLLSIECCANCLIRGIYTSNEQYDVASLPKEMVLPVPKNKVWDDLYDWIWLKPLPTEARAAAPSKVVTSRRRRVETMGALPGNDTHRANTPSLVRRSRVAAERLAANIVAAMFVSSKDVLNSAVSEDVRTQPHHRHQRERNSSSCSSSGSSRSSLGMISIDTPLKGIAKHQMTRSAATNLIEEVLNAMDVVVHHSDMPAKEAVVEKGEELADGDDASPWTAIPSPMIARYDGDKMKHVWRASTPLAAPSAIIDVGLQSSASRADKPILDLSHIIGSASCLRSVLWAPNHRSIVFAADNVIVVMDTRDVTAGSPVHDLNGSGDETGSVCIEGTVKNQRFLRGHDATVSTMTFSQSGLLASAQHGKNATVCLWDNVCGDDYGDQLEAADTNGSGFDMNPLVRLREHDHDIRSLSFDSQSKFLCVVGCDKSNLSLVVVWDVSSITTAAAAARMSGSLEGYEMPRMFIKTVVSCSISRMIFVPQPRMNVDYERDDHSEINSSVAPTPPRLVSCGDKSVRVWELHLDGSLTSTALALKEYGQEKLMELSFAENVSEVHEPRKCYIGAASGLLLIVDIASRTIESVHHLHARAITSIAVRPGFCVTASDDLFLRVWPLDFSDYYLQAQHKAPLQCVAVSIHGSSVAVSSENGCIGVLDLASTAYKVHVRTHAAAIHGLAIDSARGQFASVSGDGTIRIWDMKSRDQVYEFLAPNEVALCIAYNPIANVVHAHVMSGSNVGDGDSHIVAGFNTGAVRVMCARTAEMVMHCEQHSCDVVNVAFSASGRWLFSCDSLGNVCSYSVQDGYDAISLYHPRALRLSSRTQIYSYETAEDGALLPLPSFYHALAINATGSLVATIGFESNAIVVLDCSLNTLHVIRVHMDDGAGNVEQNDNEAEVAPSPVTVCALQFLTAQQQRTTWRCDNALLVVFSDGAYGVYSIADDGTSSHDIVSVSLRDSVARSVTAACVTADGAFLLLGCNEARSSSHDATCIPGNMPPAHTPGPSFHRRQETVTGMGSYIRVKPFGKAYEVQLEGRTFCSYASHFCADPFGGTDMQGNKRRHGRGAVDIHTAAASPQLFSENGRVRIVADGGVHIEHEAPVADSLGLSPDVRSPSMGAVIHAIVVDPESGIVVSAGGKTIMMWDLQKGPNADVTSQDPPEMTNVFSDDVVMSDGSDDGSNGRDSAFLAADESCVADELFVCCLQRQSMFPPHISSAEIECQSAGTADGVLTRHAALCFNAAGRGNVVWCVDLGILVYPSGHVLVLHSIFRQPPGNRVQKNGRMMKEGEQALLHGHTSDISTVDISPLCNGERFVASGAACNEKGACEVRIWNLKRLECVVQLEMRGGLAGDDGESVDGLGWITVQALSFDPTGNLLACITTHTSWTSEHEASDLESDGSCWMTIWRWRTRELLCVRELSSALISMHWLDSGKNLTWTLLTASSSRMDVWRLCIAADGAVELMISDPVTPIFVLPRLDTLDRPGSQHRIRSVALCSFASSSVICVGTSFGSIIIYEMPVNQVPYNRNAHQCIAAIPFSKASHNDVANPIDSLTCGEGGRLVVTSGGRVHTFLVQRSDDDGAVSVNRIRGGVNLHERVVSCSMDKAAHVGVFATEDGTIWFADTRGDRTSKGVEHRGYSAVIGGEVDVSHPVKLVCGHVGYIYDVQFDPTGQLLATCGADGSLRMWSVLSIIGSEKAPTWQLAHHQEDYLCLCVAFHPTGNVCAAGYSDGSVRVFGLQSMTVKAVLHVFDSIGGDKDAHSTMDSRYGAAVTALSYCEMGSTRDFLLVCGTRTGRLVFMDTDGHESLGQSGQQGRQQQVSALQGGDESSTVLHEGCRIDVVEASPLSRGLFLVADSSGCVVVRSLQPNGESILVSKLHLGSLYDVPYRSAPEQESYVPPTLARFSPVWSPILVCSGQVGTKAASSSLNVLDEDAVCDGGPALIFFDYRRSQVIGQVALSWLPTCISLVSRRVVLGHENRLLATFGVALDSYTGRVTAAFEENAAAAAARGDMSGLPGSQGGRVYGDTSVGKKWSSSCVVSHSDLVNAVAVSRDGIVASAGFSQLRVSRLT